MAFPFLRFTLLKTYHHLLTASPIPSNDNVFEKPSAKSLSAARGKPIKFLPHWIPQAQFADFYVATDQGFYADTGLLKTCRAAPNIRRSRSLLFASARIGTVLPACSVPTSTNSSKIYVFLSTGRRMHDESLPLTHPPHLLLLPKIRNLKIFFECVHFGYGPQDRNKTLQKEDTLIPEDSQNLFASYELCITPELLEHTKLTPFLA